MPKAKWAQVQSHMHIDVPSESEDNIDAQVVFAAELLETYASGLAHRMASMVVMAPTSQRR
jgi:hypothetical protein